MRSTEQNYKKSSAWITRCPECHSAFRVTFLHLKAANGDVRCGHCLHVFKAMQNLVSNKKPGPVDLGPQDLHSQNQDSRDSRRELLQKESVSSSRHKTVENSTVHQSIRHERAEEHRFLKPPKRNQFQPAHKKKEITDPQYQPASQERSLSKNPPLAAVAHEPLDLHFRDDRQPLMQNLLNQDPVWKHGTTLHRSLISVSAIILMLLLFGQYTAFNYNTPNSLARMTATQFCSIFHCQLSKLIDQQKIQINNVVVRNDPDYMNGLIIDTIITNQADFAQPYPVLRLIAESSDGDIVGSRLLNPNQYLAGEASGELDMPPGNPVRLSLKILKPHDNTHKISFTLAEQFWD